MSYHSSINYRAELQHRFIIAICYFKNKFPRPKRAQFTHISQASLLQVLSVSWQYLSFSTYLFMNDILIDKRT